MLRNLFTAFGEHISANKACRPHLIGRVRIKTYYILVSSQVIAIYRYSGNYRVLHANAVVDKTG